VSGSPRPRPRVVTLLAVCNGMPWLPEQVESILMQESVDVRIVVSDDGSSDGSADWLASRIAAGDPIELLPTLPPSGSSAANFRRLIRDADVSDDELVAFADQDDRWRPEKLARQAELLAAGAAAVSSNVLAFDETGATHLVRKDWPQRPWDFLTEGPGPGCSFLLSPVAFALVRAAVDTIPSAALADFHDSLVYVIVRAAGHRWRIDPTPTLDYRQHEGNVLGANHGRRAASTRFRMIRERWHRGQAVIHAQVAITVVETLDPGPAPIAPARIRGMLALLEDTGLRARFRLAMRAGALRRRPRDQAILRALILTGIW